MNNPEDWSETDDVERALIVLASFNVWTLEEAAYLSAGLLPPEYGTQQDMIVKLMLAKRTLRALESAIETVEGKLSLMFTGTGGLKVECRAVDDNGRFNAAELLGFMCHMFSERSMQTLVRYRDKGLAANAVDEIREFEFSPRSRETPEERKTGLLLPNGEVWETEHMKILGEVVENRWGPWMRGEKKVPRNDVVVNDLRGKGIPTKVAEQLATFIRPKDVPRHVQASWQITK